MTKLHMYTVIIVTGNNILVNKYYTTGNTAEVLNYFSQLVTATAIPSRQ